jgi:hypothetical protein
LKSDLYIYHFDIQAKEDRLIDSMSVSFDDAILKELHDRIVELLGYGLDNLWLAVVGKDVAKLPETLGILPETWCDIITNADFSSPVQVTINGYNSSHLIVTETISFNDINSPELEVIIG